MNTSHYVTIQVVNEMMVLFPSLFHLISDVLITKVDAHSFDKIRKIIPRIGMIYSLVVQGKLMALSRVQRVISMILVDNICDQKVNINISQCFLNKNI